MNNPREISRRKFFGETWDKFKIAGAFYLGSKLGSENFFDPKVIFADNLPDFLPNLPEKTLKTDSPDIFFGGFTPELKDAFVNLRTKYFVNGVSDETAFGKIKGVLYLNTPSGFHPLIACEKAVYHSVDGQLQSTLGVKDAITQTVQCDSKGQKIYSMQGVVAKRLAEKNVDGDGGDKVVSGSKIRKRITILGNENYDNNTIGQLALRTLDENGKEGVLNSEVYKNKEEDITLTDYVNGHNVPGGIKKYIWQSAGRLSDEIFGLPISDPYWMWTNVGGNFEWVLWQAFERKTVTYTPPNDKKYKWQTGLIGNWIVSSVLGNENPKSVEPMENIFPYEVFPQIFTSGDRNSNRIALTMDDGWDGNMVSIVSKILKDKGIKITFFPVATTLPDKKELWQDIIEAGNEIGFHTFSHDNLLSMSKDQILANLQKNQQVIDETLGEHYSTRFLRPPGGNGGYNGGSKNVLDAAAAGGYSIAMWSIDPIKEPNSDAFYNHVVSRVQNGSVILMHFNANDVAALPQIIDNVLSRGFVPTTLSGLFA